MGTSQHRNAPGRQAPLNCPSSKIMYGKPLFFFALYCNHLSGCLDLFLCSEKKGAQQWAARSPDESYTHDNSLRFVQPIRCRAWPPQRMKEQGPDNRLAQLPVSSPAKQRPKKGPTSRGKDHLQSSFQRDLAPVRFHVKRAGG